MCSFKPPEIIQETSLSWFMHQNVNEVSFFPLLPVKLRHSQLSFDSTSFLFVAIATRVPVSLQKRLPLQVVCRYCINKRRNKQINRTHIFLKKTAGKSTSLCILVAGLCDLAAATLQKTFTALENKDACISCTWQGHCVYLLPSLQQSTKILKQH